MELNSILTLIATLLSPLFAIQVTRILDRRRERRERRMSVFRTLMANRAQRLGREYVEALNMIDVEFGEKSAKDRKVVDAWKMCLDHLNRFATPDAAWGSRLDELFADLLYVMGQSLGYDFDRVHIRNQTYSPRGHGEVENDQITIRA